MPPLKLCRKCGQLKNSIEFCVSSADASKTKPATNCKGCRETQYLANQRRSKNRREKADEEKSALFTTYVWEEIQKQFEAKYLP